MSEMFAYCSSLSSLNLSNFNSNNFTHMRKMFFGMNKNYNLICNDYKIKNEFSEF